MALSRRHLRKDDSDGRLALAELAINSGRTAAPHLRKNDSDGRLALAEFAISIQQGDIGARQRPDALLHPSRPRTSESSSTALAAALRPRHRRVAGALNAADAGDGGDGARAAHAERRAKVDAGRVDAGRVDAGRVDPVLPVGVWVLLRTEGLLDADYFGKLRPSPPWDGSFTVTACPGPITAYT